MAKQTQPPVREERVRRRAETMKMRQLGASLRLRACRGASRTEDVQSNDATLMYGVMS
jgi:hypothetical protein